MKWVVRGLGALVGLIVLLAAAAYLLPREVTVTRSTVIDAPPETIWPFVSSLEQTSAWSPWMSLDPELRVTYSGPASGVGNRMEWSSDQPSVGSGAQEIVAATENERVESALDFGDMGTATAAIALAPAGAATQVTWDLRADMGNGPVGRWMGLMMDRWVGADYDKGLANLKSLVEGG